MSGMTKDYELALRWFKANGIPAYHDDWNGIFIEVNGMDFEIHTCEIVYRADLQKGIEDEKVSGNI